MAKVMIVFEDTGGPNFNVYMDGDKERIVNKKIDVKDLSGAEYHAARCFSIVGKYLEKTGVLKKSINMGEADGQEPN